MNEQSYFAKLRSEETQLLDTGPEVSVWFAIKSFAGEGICYASIRQLSSRAHVAKDTVERAIIKIIDVGLLIDLGFRKPPYGHWKTRWLQLSDYQTEVSDQRTKVSGVAAEVSDPTYMKHKGNNKEITPFLEETAESKDPGLDFDPTTRKKLFQHAERSRT